MAEKKKAPSLGGDRDVDPADGAVPDAGPTTLPVEYAKKLGGLFRVNDRTYLLTDEDIAEWGEANQLRLGVNTVRIGDETYDLVRMPQKRWDDMGNAAMVVASKALASNTLASNAFASSALANAPVVTVQNAGKEDLKKASSAWQVCRDKRDAYSFSNLSEAIDPLVLPPQDDKTKANNQARSLPPGVGFCSYDALKDAIDKAWENAVVPDTFESFDGTGTRRDSAVDIAMKILSRQGGQVAERASIPWADLIWSYWMEEAGLVQAMNILALRFQNRAIPGKAEFLRNFELDALRPLSHFIWEYIEAEPHRLSVVRRAYEYEHEYGLRLVGKAVDGMDPYERRHGFIGGFNMLVHLAHKLFRDEDDLQRKADAFPLLNQLQELQSLVQEGAHNQYPELVKKARTEMLMQQYIFTLSPVQEFIRSRPMVVYEEPWMGPLDAMRQAMGWDPVSVSVYHKLAEKSETLLTTIRNYDWVHENVTDAARSWAQSFRNEIQSYAHSYRTVTGIDLTEALLVPEHASQPSQLIRSRLEKAKA